MIKTAENLIRLILQLVLKLGIMNKKEGSFTNKRKREARWSL